MTYLKSITSISAGALILIAGSGRAGAQSLAQRVADVRDGSVRVSFNLKPGICGHGNSILRGNSGTTNWGNDQSQDVEWEGNCYSGPGRLVLDRQEGETVSLRFYVGGRWRPRAGVTDLGSIAAPEVANYLTALAQTANGRLAGKAIFPATLVDSANVWPALLRLARDQTRPREPRTQAVFWLGQAAGDSATAHLTSLATDNDLDREVRKQAVFALSQRPASEGIPALITIAKSNRDPELRKNALFWLGQSNDPRAIDLFEELILRK